MAAKIINKILKDDGDRYVKVIIIRPMHNQRSDVDDLLDVIKVIWIFLVWIINYYLYLIN